MKRMLLPVLVIGVLLLSACEPTQTPKPENVVPESVPGFELFSKDDHAGPTYVRQEYEAIGRFQPKEGSEFQGKVRMLMIDVMKFEDETSASEIASELSYLLEHTVGQKEINEIKVDGIRATLIYDKDSGLANVLWQHGSLLIVCGVFPSSEATTPDEQTIKDACIEAARATAQNL